MPTPRGSQKAVSKRERRARAKDEVSSRRRRRGRDSPQSSGGTKKDTPPARSPRRRGKTNQSEPGPRGRASARDQRSTRSKRSRRNRKPTPKQDDKAKARTPRGNDGEGEAKEKEAGEKAAGAKATDKQAEPKPEATVRQMPTMVAPLDFVPTEGPRSACASRLPLQIPTITPESIMPGPREEPPGVLPPVVKAWVDETLAKNVAGIREEFTANVARYVPPVVNKNAFSANLPRNRYKDVVCVDDTRVVLRDHTTDYVHANWVAGSTGDRTYICTQAPKAETTQDLWAMIWQEEVNVIMMLCELIENNRPKCAPYWPENEKQTLTYGQFSVTHVSNKPEPLACGKTAVHTLLELTLEGNAPRTVHHIQWADWPDRGVPADCRSTLKLRGVLLQYALGRPIVVHCSAGIGRTGTLVAIDLAVHSIDNSKPINMVEMVKGIRNQRLSSVQTEQQYVFIYRAALEYAFLKYAPKLQDSPAFKDFCDACVAWATP